MVAVERLVAEKKLFKRLVLSGEDLRHAKEFAGLILSLNLHGASGAKDELIHIGLNLALVVSYWRPFSSNGGTRDALPRLPERFRDRYSPDQNTLHMRVRDLRNKAFAHTDAGAYRVRVSVREWKEAKFAIPTRWYGLEPLPKHEVALLDSMIDELNWRISEERHRIQELLDVDDRF